MDYIMDVIVKGAKNQSITQTFFTNNSMEIGNNEVAGIGDNIITISRLSDGWEVKYKNRKELLRMTNTAFTTKYNIDFNSADSNCFFIGSTQVTPYQGSKVYSKVEKKDVNIYYLHATNNKNQIKQQIKVNETLILGKNPSSEKCIALDDDGLLDKHISIQMEPNEMVVTPISHDSVAWIKTSHLLLKLNETATIRVTPNIYLTFQVKLPSHSLPHANSTSVLTSVSKKPVFNISGGIYNQNIIDFTMKLTGSREVSNYFLSYIFNPSNHMVETLNNYRCKVKTNLSDVQLLIIIQFYRDNDYDIIKEMKEHKIE